VKLLFDENVSPKLVRLLENEYPESAHVREIGLRGTTDAQIWDHAREHGFVIVSKDEDFRQRSFLMGAPPKVLWLQVGNSGTQAIADLLRQETGRIAEFESEEESSFLIVRRAV
jgi:predicted nuclease of predicted toxin-antitoxin system